jgi:Endoplasmic reticulum-based factor for assembly of V-ATPase.
MAENCSHATYALTFSGIQYREKLRSGLISDAFFFLFLVKQINRQLIAVAQFVFSVLAGFAFGFIGIELTVGNLDFGFRLLLGVMCALIIALAEIYFLAKKLSEDLPSTQTVSAQHVNLPSKPHQE